MNGYAPRTGSTGERAVTYLMENGRTLKSILATELDVEPSALDASLNLCVTNEIVKREVEGGNTYYDLAEVKLDAAQPPAAREIPQFVPDGSVPSVNSRRPAVSVFDGLAELEPYRAKRDEAGGLPHLEIKVTAPEGLTQEKAGQISVAVAQGMRRSSMRSEFVPPVSAAAPENPRNKRQFDIGIFSSGELILRFGDESIEMITLDREETEKLVDFIEKIGSIRA